MSTLILIRHGQSTWNAANLFTGWVDVPLSDKGVDEARLAGERLAAAGFRVDRAFTSELRRAAETGRLVLEALGQASLPQTRAWQLNERFYGALTGLDKAATAAEYGTDQVHLWRRSFSHRPPGGESLEDTMHRTLPWFRATVLPATREHEVVLVTAHGNSLRAIVKELDGLSDEAVAALEIATGVPLVYTMIDGRPTDKKVLA